jgi:lysophospholipase L1-like esterase
MRALRGLSITIITFLGCIVFAELFLGLFAPVPDPYDRFKYERMLNQYIKSEFPPNYKLVTEAEEGLPGVKGRNVFTTNNMGYRGDHLFVPKPKDEFRIFMIGGSTTECIYLDDSHAINTTLQQYFQKNLRSPLSVKVYNAGKSGDASPDHLSMLVHRIMHLEPDLIVVFSGINDLFRSIYSYDYLHYGTTAKGAKYPVFQFFASEFQLPRRLYYLMKRVAPTEREVLQDITLKTNIKAKVAFRRSIPVTDEAPRVDIKSYATNLKTIVGITKSHGTRLVLMTQQTTYASSIDPNVSDWQWSLRQHGKTYSEQSMHEALESLNNAMRQVAGEYTLPLYDLARLLPKSLEFFYDDVHFNVKGASIAGKELGRYILESGLLTGKTEPNRFARGLDQS